MKKFEPVTFDLITARAELDAFSKLITANTWLDEREEIMPCFKKRKQLSLLIGMLDASHGCPDRIAYEYDIFGSFSCDLVVADSVSNVYTLVEFEDATRSSLFKFNKARYCPEWGSRFEHGFSQLVDWFWNLSEFSQTPEFGDRFKSKNPTFNGMLIMGRIQGMEDREKRRLRWREDKLMLDSRHCRYLTLDDLRDRLSARLDLFEQVARTRKQGNRKT